MQLPILTSVYKGDKPPNTKDRRQIVRDLNQEIRDLCDSTEDWEQYMPTMDEITILIPFTSPNQQ